MENKIEQEQSANDRKIAWDFAEKLFKGIKLLSQEKHAYQLPNPHKNPKKDEFQNSKIQSDKQDLPKRIPNNLLKNKILKFSQKTKENAHQIQRNYSPFSKEGIVHK
jgi:primosomal protein N''